MTQPVATSLAPPPVAARRSHTFTHHGITVEDPYFWLKDQNYPEVNDPDVLSYLRAENNYFEQAMAPLQEQIDLLFQELKDRQPEEDSSVPYFDRGYWYQWRFHQGAQYRTWYRLAGSAAEMPSLNAAWQILLDETALAAGQDYFRLGAMSVSPDTRKLAYSLDTDGSERFQLHVIDIDSGDALTTPIRDTMGNPVWDQASTHLSYVVVSPEWRPYQVYLRNLEYSQAEDVLLYEEADTGYFVGINLSASEQYLFIASGDHTTSEVYFVPTANLNEPPTLIQARQVDHEYYADHDDEGLLIRSNQRQANFDLYRAAVEAPDQGHWQCIVEGGPDRYITGFLPFKHQLVVAEKNRGLDQLFILSAQDEHYIEFPESAYHLGFGANPDFTADTLRLTYTSMVTPNTVMDYSFGSRQLNTLKVQQIPSGYDPDEFVTRRIHAPARDGEEIPVSLVHHRDTPLDGSAPLYLYGYGAYGAAIAPAFSASRISLLQRGFVFAIAHIRGGDDLGYRWYTEGKLAKRTNTFNDFVDVANHLVNQQFTAAGRIAIAGGSAGGELMGAVVNQAPHLWGAVASHVPFVDVLNTMLDESLPLTPMEWPEWGNPIEDEAAFR